MKNIFKLATFCSISLLLFSCRPEETIEDDPIENQSTINQQKMEYNLPYLSQSFTLSGTFFNGSQNFNIEIIFQNSPTKSLYKYFEYVDENGNSIGQQDLDIYFEDDSGKAKAYIVDNKNNAKITNVYNSSTQEEIEFDTYFANPFIGLTKDSFTYQNNGAYLKSDSILKFINSIYGFTSSQINASSCYITFNGDNVDKLHLEFLTDGNTNVYDLKFSNVSNSRITNLERIHLDVHDNLDDAFANLSNHLNKANPDSFMLELKQDLDPMMKSTNMNIYFLGDSIYIQQENGVDIDILSDDTWLLVNEFGLIDAYSYDEATGSFSNLDSTNTMYSDYLPGISKNEVASEIFDYIGENKYLACSDVLATLGNSLISETFLDLNGVGNEFVITLNSNNLIDNIEFSYSKFFTVRSSIKYKDFNDVTLPEGILDTKPKNN